MDTNNENNNDDNSWNSVLNTCKAGGRQPKHEDDGDDDDDDDADGDKDDDDDGGGGNGDDDDIMRNAASKRWRSHGIISWGTQRKTYNTPDKAQIACTTKRDAANDFSFATNQFEGRRPPATINAGGRKQMSNHYIIVIHVQAEGRQQIQQTT